MKGRSALDDLSCGLTVVNQIPLEDYLVGAVKAEAGDKMPIEMLKAQAIVARTYAAYHRRLNAEKTYHLVASTLNQQYVGRVLWVYLLGVPPPPAHMTARENSGVPSSRPTTSGRHGDMATLEQLDSLRRARSANVAAGASND